MKGELDRIATKFSYYQMESGKWCGTVGISYMTFARSERRIRNKIAVKIRRVRNERERKTKTMVTG